MTEISNSIYDNFECEETKCGITKFINPNLKNLLKVRVDYGFIGMSLTDIFQTIWNEELPSMTAL